MVRELIQEGLLRSTEVVNAMSKVPRELFVPEHVRKYAYSDAPLPTDQGQTISAPHMVAIMNEALELKKGQIVLEIGAGSGYHAAVIAEQIAPDGLVYSIERISQLVALARGNLERAGYSDRVTLLHGDGSVGYLDRSPYDRILVTAAAPKVPAPLVDQLKAHGILLVPVGGRLLPQDLVRVRKGSQGEIIRDSLGGVAFVPLIGDQGFEH